MLLGRNRVQAVESKSRGSGLDHGSNQLRQNFEVLVVVIRLKRLDPFKAPGIPKVVAVTKQLAMRLIVDSSATQVRFRSLTS
jgi:hypothetical protein